MRGRPGFWRAVFAVLVIMALCRALEAGETDGPLFLRAVPDWVAGKKAKLLLYPGVELKGKIVSVDEDRLFLDVKETSDRRTYPQGRRASISFSSIYEVRVRTHKSQWGRVICTSTVGYAGSMLGSYAAMAVIFANEESSSAAAPILIMLGSVSGSIAGGYILGEYLDRETVVIKLDRAVATEGRDSAPAAVPQTLQSDGSISTPPRLTE